jgi:flagellar motility protein MotE (MotC chaperone)
VSEVQAQQTPGERPTDLLDDGEDDEDLLEDDEDLLEDDEDALADGEDELDDDEFDDDEFDEDELEDEELAGDEEPLLGEESDTAGEDSLLEENDLNQSELDVLQMLRERRVELDVRAERLDLREKLVLAAEHALESRIQDWKQLKVAVEASLEKYNTKRDGKLQTLATYYEKMKAKDAARVFNSLELPYLIDIVERMKVSKVADIIGKMDTERAKTLTTELARQHQLSVSQDLPTVRN